MKRHCPVQGKVCYRTKKKALKAADRQRNSYETHGGSVAADCTVYPCGYCGNYHLTKSPRMKVAA